MSGSNSGFHVDTESLEEHGRVLVRLAGRMQAFRPQLSALEGTDAPHVHPDVARAALSFAQFAADQYQDAVALLAALSIKLRYSSELYRVFETEQTRQLGKFLEDSSLVPFYLRGI